MSRDNSDKEREILFLASGLRGCLFWNHGVSLWRHVVFQRG